MAVGLLDFAGRGQTLLDGRLAEGVSAQRGLKYLHFLPDLALCPCPCPYSNEE
jgi:hypothetical protein